MIEPNAKRGEGPRASASRVRADDQALARWSAGSIALVAGVVVLVAVVAWRATFGISPFDDGHGAAVVLRMAHGARPFTDEMTFQALGFVPALPFAKVWLALFGTSGFVVALRMFYVALSAVAGGVAVWALRPAFGASRSLIAVAAVVLALPYNVIGVSYNTSALLCFVCATAIGFSAVRERSWRRAAVTGALAALGSAAHPPLMFAAIVLALAIAVAARDRRVILGLVGGGLLTAAAIVAALFSVTTVEDIQRTLAYTQAMAARAGKVGTPWGGMWDAIRRPAYWPAWALALAASIPGVASRWRSWVAGLIPIAIAAPSMWRLAAGLGWRYFGVLGTAYLALLMVALILPVGVWLWRAPDRHDERLLLAIGAPAGLVGLAIAAWFTSSGIIWAVWMFAAAPLVIGVLIAWQAMVAEGAGRAASVVFGAMVVLVLLVSLLAIVFKDTPIAASTQRITSGPLAGVATSPSTAAKMAEVSAQSKRYLRPGESIVNVIGPVAYVLAGDASITNATWLSEGPADVEAIRYFERTGKMPEAAFIGRRVIDEGGGIAAVVREDPLVGWIGRRYTFVDEGRLYYVFLRNDLVAERAPEARP